MFRMQCARRNFLKVTATSLAAGYLSPLLAATQGGFQERPNILFCLADDWGWPHAGAYGDEVVQTPAFDRIAEDGVLFEHAFISAPSCTPSRNSMLTGQQFYRLGEGANLWSTLDVKVPNFMFMLREQGYEIGHWRKAWGPGNFRAGGYREHPCGPRCSFSDFMKNRDKSKPFCFWFGTSDPHRPYEKNSGRESGMDIDAVHVPAFWPNTEPVRSDIADYYFEVQRWDSDVGNAIKLIEATSELDNTIIVMTGDHGMPFPRAKGNLYDWGARVPLAISWAKNIKGGRRVTDFVSLTDLAPTFLQAAGVQVPDVMTGKSLLSILRHEGDGRIEAERDSVVFGRERHVTAQAMPSVEGYPVRALRTDRWLLIMNLEPDRWPAGVPTGSTHPFDSYADCDHGPTKSFLVEHAQEFREYYELCFAKRPAVELYNCVSDPDQVLNLADKPDYADVIETLKEKLVGYLEATEDPRFTDAEVKFDDYPYRANYAPRRPKKN